jgi:hypothetical protein
MRHLAQLLPFDSPHSHILLHNAGAPWSCMVHILGTCHGSPVNPRALHEVAEAVGADAIAMEGTEDMKNRLRKMSEFLPIARSLERMMANPVEGTVQAHSLLSTYDLKDWERGLCSAGLALADELDHYVLGRPDLSDPLSGEGRRGMHACHPCQSPFYSAHSSPWPPTLSPCSPGPRSGLHRPKAAGDSGND